MLQSLLRFLLIMTLSFVIFGSSVNGYAQNDQLSKRKGEIEEAYKRLQYSEVIDLVNQFLKDYDKQLDGPSKIGLLEKKAYSQYKLVKNKDAETTVYEILKLEIEWSPDIDRVPQDIMLSVQETLDKIPMLRIITKPVGSKISIDDKQMEDQPQDGFKLLSGEHTIKIDPPPELEKKYKSKKKTVFLSKHKNDPLEIKLRRKLPSYVYYTGGAAVVVGGGIIYYCCKYGCPRPKPLPMHPARPTN